MNQSTSDTDPARFPAWRRPRQAVFCADASACHEGGAEHRLAGAARWQQPEIFAAPLFAVAGTARRLLAVLALLALFVPVPSLAAGDAWDVAKLMRLLSAEPAGEARFTERKHIAILDEPVLSSGELRFRAPDRLEKITRTPKPEALVLEGDTLTITRGERRHALKLSDYPQVAAFIDSIRATLAGDRAALERTYALQLSGSAERWSLALLPRDPKMAETVLRISIRGSHAQLSEIEILQAGGDRSVMTIQPVTPTR